MSSQTKWMLFGGLGLGVVSGLLMYFNKKSAPLVAREQLLKALTDLNGQSFSLFITTAGVVKKIMAETGCGYQLENGKNVGDLIRDEVEKQFEQKKASILDKYGIESNDFATSINDDYGKDEQIQRLVNAILDGLEEALKGNGPSLEVKPEMYKILTKEKSLDISTKILIQSSKSYLQVLKALESEGEKNITLSHPKVSRRIGELDMKQKKRLLMQNEGVFIEPDSPTEVLGKVTVEYKEKDPEFSRKLMEIQRIYISVQDRLAKDITTEEEIDNEFKQINK